MTGYKLDKYCSSINLKYYHMKPLFLLVLGFILCSCQPNSNKSKHSTP